VDFAKEQVELLLRTRYQHPNGQIPAYEWNFGDVNPPVTAWAALFVYEREAEIRGEGDREFLERVFNRLLTNFTWWVNRKDPDDRNLFQGGFLGLDNIGIFDRSAPLPGGGTLEQADGTAWMALYCQWMLQIAAELARHDPAYVDMALKFLAHFGWISIAMNPPGADTGLWDEEEGFYYDVMRMPDGTRIELKVRSLVGLLPLCAATVLDGELAQRYPQLVERATWFLHRFAESIPELMELPGPNPEGHRLAVAGQRGPAAPHPRRHARRAGVPRPARDPRDLAPPPRAPLRLRMGRPGVRRALPAGRVRQRHVRRQLQLARPGLVPDEPRDHPRAAAAAPLLRRPAEGRVPGRLRTASWTSARSPPSSAAAWPRPFTDDADGRRPVFGGIEKFQTDPHWHDLLLFHEYFHGDNGAGLGASHQTGWTGTVALLLLLGGGVHARPGAATPVD
jgi:hypothetical protein